MNQYGDRQSAHQFLSHLRISGESQVTTFTCYASERERVKSDKIVVTETEPVTELYKLELGSENSL